MSQVKRPRRYYLGKRYEATVLEEWDLAGFWRWKQERMPGVALSADFPYRARLAEHGYTTLEDVDGADIVELGRVGFTTREAETILAAVPALPVI